MKTLDTLFKEYLGVDKEKSEKAKDEILKRIRKISNEEDVEFLFELGVLKYSKK